MSANKKDKKNSLEGPSTLQHATSLKVFIFGMTIKEYLMCLVLISTLIQEFSELNEFEFDQHLEKDKSGKKFMISIKKQDQAKVNQTKTESNDFSLAGQDGKNDRSTLEQGHGKGQGKVVQPNQHVPNMFPTCGK